MGTCYDDRIDSEEMMADSGKEDHKWSGEKMEGDEGLNTVECLRKRLLAERQTSRLAKEEEESMGNKLIELEKKLKEEVKLREKYERKLKFLKKKLESFNIASISGESEQSYSSEKRDNTCRSSSSSASRDPEENEIKSHIANPAASQDSSIAKDSDSQVTDDSSSSSNPNPSSEDGKRDESSSSSKSSAKLTGDSIPNLNPDNFSTKNPSFKELKNDGNRVSSVSSESSVTVTVADNEGDDGDFVDNSLAIVPVNLTSTKQAINPKPVNESVIEVLDALRLARERLMGSMGTRQMVKVGT
ncbi:hypothetical protein L6164_009847 [Bauhinia variegata]|uniref:Uncharacterized protein n=1 Tax=Bauhinia variegata TaxID=167791 RepID=A0ACB9PL08_BAUVA|nr:hypothetical protein L6164_009847 [Bauhinia variegata]